MSNKTASMIVDLDNVRVNTSWAKSELVIEHYDNGEVTRRVTIQIGHPYELIEIRAQLDKIEHYWRQKLEALKA